MGKGGECHGLLDIHHNPRFPLDKIGKRKATMWRYREAIPIENDCNIISLGEGFTPMVGIDLIDNQILFKQDQLFPTGSYKDRGASVLLSKIRELGVTPILEDSSGNAGCAVSAYSARAGIPCKIYVPEKTSPGKIRQIVAYGADIAMVPGGRDMTAKEALKAAENTYYASHSWNPFFFHGTKTFAFEVAEQLGWSEPDVLVLPVGNGTLLLGSYIGFSELKDAGIIKRIPRIIGVQSRRCAPLAKAFEAISVSSGEGLAPSVDGTCTTNRTIAEGIAVSDPARALQILDAVKGTSGRFVTVDENEIRTALRFAHGLGFFIEPTSAVTLAALMFYFNDCIKGSENLIVSVFTGHGLKSWGH